MLGSVVTVPSKPPGLRRSTYSTAVNPPLPPRRHSLSTGPSALTAPLQLKSVTLSGGMESRYNRPSSPQGRYSNPARSSTGTFRDPYYDSSYYARPSSPRTSGDRLPTSYNQSYYTPATSSGSRVSNVKYDSYSGRPRRNTNEHTSRPAVASLTTLPIRTPYSPHHTHADRPASPLSHSWAQRGGDTYISHGGSRRDHKKVYSVDDSGHAKIVAEGDVASPRSATTRYSVAGSSGYPSKPPSRLNDLNDDGYSYTDPASMYRDTEPVWRRPRAGSLERSSRPTSMIVDRPTRSSARESGPPPSTRGFDRINHSNSNISKGSIAKDSRAPHRSSSIERSRGYDPYPDTSISRSSSTRQPAIHQEPREHRRDTYHEDYDRRSSRDLEPRGYNPVDNFKDRDVASRGFGIGPGNPNLTHEHHSLDRQPIYPPQDTSRSRPEERSNQYYTADRNSISAQMPEPRLPRETAPPRDRDSARQDNKGFVPAAAGAAAGMAATIGAASYMKSRDKERDRDNDRDSSGERERERRREHDERDRRDRYDDRRERGPDERYDERRDRRDPPPAPASVSAASVPNPSTSEPDRKLSRDRRYGDDDRERTSRKAASSEGSGDERPRHYVDRDAERRKEAAPKEAALDPDEEYRRRVQQEAERSSRSTREREPTDPDRERDHRRRKDDRERSRSRHRDEPSRSATKDAPSSRYDERSSSVYDASLVQEPESMDGALVPSGKSVQIVTPPKDGQPAVKGILRKPTEKFPEDPEPIREGVAPHKDAMKGKDIPVGARWTRIDRRLVNPEALEQAKERFEERMDCVIVLRVLTKQEIQKLADRTKKIREAREDEYERSERGDRDSRSNRRDDRDDEDRDRERDRDRDRERRRRYDDEDSDYDDMLRERERERDRPKMLEPAR